MTATEIIHKLKLEPLPGEGGYFRETWRSAHILPETCLPPGYAGDRCSETCIYYMITPQSFSQMHKLPGPEIWHFYLGDPAEQLQISTGGEVKTIIIGNDIEKGQHPQVVVPANAWQGTRLVEGGKYALFGTGMSPGFEFTDYIAGDPDFMTRSFPGHADQIKMYFHNDQ